MSIANGDNGGGRASASVEIPSARRAPGEEYSFEQSAPNAQIRHPREVKEDYAIFAHRLGLDPQQERALRRSLMAFVIHHHANIDWYDTAIKNELCRRWTYFIGSLVLLGLIPAGIYFLTATDGHETAGITSGLSGLFAFHRGITAWLDKRQLVALYSKTRAQLKTAVYSLEQTWNPDHRGTVGVDALRVALDSATAAARLTVSAEEDAHYEIEAAPTFGLDELLGAATSRAGDLTGALAQKQSQDEKDRRDVERRIRELQAQTVEFRDLLNQRRADLASAADADRATIIAELNEISAKSRAAELELAIQTAKLSSL